MTRQNDQNNKGFSIQNLFFKGEVEPKQSDIEVLSKQDLTKHSEVDKAQIKYWEREYINSRIDSIKNTKHKILFMLLWRTGCRVSEALGLRKRDIDLENYTLTIRWLKSRKAYSRNIPIQAELRTILSVYLSNMLAENRLFDFTRQRADQLARKYFAGSCHKFRHSFAVNWLRQGGDLYLLSKMLGHSSIKVTEVYLQIVPAEVGKELQKIQFN